MRSWEQRLVDEPDDGLERLAESRGVTVEALRARHARVSDVLGQPLGEGPDGPHLSLNELARSSIPGDELALSRQAHLVRCDVCRELRTALHPDASPIVAPGRRGTAGAGHDAPGGTGRFGFGSWAVAAAPPAASRWPYAGAALGVAALAFAAGAGIGSRSGAPPTRATLEPEPGVVEARRAEETAARLSEQRRDLEARRDGPDAATAQLGRELARTEAELAEVRGELVRYEAAWPDMTATFLDMSPPPTSLEELRAELQAERQARAALAEALDEAVETLAERDAMIERLVEAERTSDVQ